MNAERRTGLGRRALVGGGLAAVAGGALASVPAPVWAQGGGPVTASGTTEAANVYELLLNRWREVVIGGGKPDGAYGESYAEAVAARDRSALNHLASLVTDEDAPTPWPDLPLDEEDPLSANVSSVIDRLRGIAVACATEGSELYGDENAAGRAAAGCRLWWRARYHEGQAQYGNWWDWEIGGPRAATDTLTLLGAAVDEETRAGILAAIDHFVPDPRQMLRGELESTGANRVDLCRIVALRGALGQDDERLELGSEALAGVLDPVPVGDGFHADGSFIMHTSVAYPGTYGQVLVKGMAELMRLLEGTEWDVAQNERQLTTGAIDTTFVPFVHQGLMADAVRGRAVARHNASDADDGFKLTIDLLTLADALPAAEAADAARLRAVAKGWLQRNDWRELSDRQPAQIATAASVLADDAVTPEDGPLGHFGYPDMERFVHRRPGWTYCLSLNSDRVARYEYMNGENAHGWHTGDGMAQLFLDSDRFQYTDAFWPTANPKRLAGITVDTAPLGTGAGGDNDEVPLSGTRWSGEVRLGDYALAGMDFRGIESPLRARKSWLFLDDAVLAAGSGIAAEDGRRIETAVEHRALGAPDEAVPGELRIDGRRVPEGLGEPMTHRGVRWAHLGGTGGYVFLGERAEVRSLREDRTGSWRDIHLSGPEGDLTRRFVSLWHDHGTDPDGAQYAHLLLPGATFGATAARAAYPGVEVLELSEDVHAFRTTPGGLGRAGATLTAVVFHAAGSAAGVTADGPCAVLLLEENRTLRVAVSEPSRAVPTVQVDLAITGYDAVRECDDELTVLASGTDGTRLFVETGGSHGASRSATFAPGQPAQARRARLVAPDADATVRAGRHSGANDGTSPELVVWRADTEDDTRRACLRFPLPPQETEVVRAVLWVYGAIPKDPDSRASDMLWHPLRAYDVSGSRWSEDEVSWDTAPVPGEALGDAPLTTYPDWAGLEVTEAVRRAVAEGVEPSFVLAQEEVGHETRLHSREAEGHRPVLQLLTR